MKRWAKVLLNITICIMFFFVSIGYATISDIFNISGSAQATVTEGIFITEITEVSTSNIDKNDFSFISPTTNIVNTVSRGSADSDGVIVYEVTIYNNTHNTYYYRDNYYQTELDEYNGNDYISDTYIDGCITIEAVFENESDNAKKISPQETKVFNVIYTVSSGIVGDIDLSMLVNIRFGIHVSGNNEALDMIESRFLEILNTPNTYNQLIDVLDNKFDGINDWSSNYVGNVAGATSGAFSDDSVAVNTLFQNQLQMTIDGELKEATVIIKHENIDWDNSTGDDYVATHPSGATYTGTGCEMVLYLTIDELTNPYEYVTVYAMIFTCDRSWQTGEFTSDWYHLGCTFIGKAEVSDYDGTVGGTGSFRTTTWSPIATSYPLIEGYNFKIKNETKFDNFYIDAFSFDVYPASQHQMYYLLETWNEEAPVVILQLINDAKRILDNMNYAGEGINQLRAVYEKYYWLYGYTGTPNLTWPYPSLRRFYPAMQELYSAIINVANEIGIFP